MRFSNILVLVWAATLSTLASGQTNLRTISVTGQGTVTAAPDMATISAGLTTKAVTATAALDGNSAVVDEIFLVLESDPYNIDEADIQTMYFNIYPEYNYTYDNPYGNSFPDIMGYSVSNSVSVKVRDLDILGELLDALITAGATQVDGVSFGFNNVTALTTRARKLAWSDAKSRAQLYAETAQVTLGSILSVQEPGANEYYSPGFGMKESAMDMGAGVPIATGEQEVTAYINVVYEIAS